MQTLPGTSVHESRSQNRLVLAQAIKDKNFDRAYGILEGMDTLELGQVVNFWYRNEETRDIPIFFFLARLAEMDLEMMLDTLLSMKATSPAPEMWAPRQTEAGKIIFYKAMERLLVTDPWQVRNLGSKLEDCELPLSLAELASSKTKRLELAVL